MISYCQYETYNSIKVVTEVIKSCLPFVARSMSCGKITLAMTYELVENNKNLLHKL